MATRLELGLQGVLRPEVAFASGMFRRIPADDIHMRFDLKEIHLVYPCVF